MRVCPSAMGGFNGSWTGAYDPATDLIFAPAIDSCMTYMKGIATYVKGIPYFGGYPNMVDGQAGKAYGSLSAIEVKTGKVKWRYRDARPMMAGVVATSGGVLFTSNLEGEALAFDQASGTKLWSFRMNGEGRGQPIVYELDGKPYVAISSGGFLTMDILSGKYSAVPEAGELFVFSLD